MDSFHVLLILIDEFIVNLEIDLSQRSTIVPKNKTEYRYNYLAYNAFRLYLVTFFRKITNYFSSN